MSVSRRQFLQVMGLSAFGPLLPASSITQAIEGPLTGRILHPTPAYSPSDGVTQLWADTRVQLLRRAADWYETEQGRVAVTAVQPMLPTPTPGRTSPPFAAQVTGPVAVIHAYCDMRAPRVTRVGHGGVLTVVDRIQYEQTGAWYALADATGQQIGWSQAVHWQAVQVGPGPQQLALTLDREQRSLEAGGHRVRVNVPPGLVAGRTTVIKTAIGGGTVIDAGESYTGTPYHMHLPTGTALYGVYWHNDFGRAADRALELPVWAAAQVWAARDVYLTII